MLRFCCKHKEARRLRMYERALDALATAPYAYGVTRFVLAGTPCLEVKTPWLALCVVGVVLLSGGGADPAQVQGLARARPQQYARAPAARSLGYCSWHTRCRRASHCEGGWAACGLGQVTYRETCICSHHQNLETRRF